MGLAKPWKEETDRARVKCPLGGDVLRIVHFNDKFVRERVTETSRGPGEVRSGEFGGECRAGRGEKGKEDGGHAGVGGGDASVRGPRGRKPGITPRGML